MIRATSVLRRAAVKPERVADTLTLDHEARHRRRIALSAEGGLEFLLDLDRATALDDGDAVRLEDGRLVQIKAAPERLIEITTDNPLRLMKVAWHIGNRHVAAEIGEDALYIGYDHVLLEMVRGLGAKAREVSRPFRPERGAYEGGHGHAHEGHAHDAHAQGAHDHGAHDHGDHDHDRHPQEHHGHANTQADHGACGCGHDHGHAHDHAHGAAHDHGHAHAHDHSHDRGHAHRHG